MTENIKDDKKYEITEDPKKETFYFPYQKMKVLAISKEEILLFDESTGEEKTSALSEFAWLDHPLSTRDYLLIYTNKDGKTFYDVKRNYWWVENLTDFWHLITNGFKKSAKNIKEKTEQIDTDKMKQTAMDWKDKGVEFSKQTLEKVDTDKLTELKDNLMDKMPHSKDENPEEVKVVSEQTKAEEPVITETKSVETEKSENTVSQENVVEEDKKENES